MIKIVTHNAKFHTDDVFAVAALFLMLGEENCQVFRTRDKTIVENGDYVVDVGEVYNKKDNRFDHHQAGGAGKRPNGIPYASIGLVWRAYGEKITGSKEVVDSIDRSLIQQIDASDNGMNLFTSLIPDVMPSGLGGIVDLYRSTWKEDEDWNRRFLECVHWAVIVLQRKIKIARDFEEAASIVREVYQDTKDKRVIFIDGQYSLGREVVTDTLSKFPEPLYAVLYRKDHGEWQVVAMRKEFGSFELRKPLPAEWGAKHDEELAKASGVLDAKFCHRGLFMCTALSQDGALKLAKKALNE